MAWCLHYLLVSCRPRVLLLSAQAEVTITCKNKITALPPTYPTLRDSLGALGTTPESLSQYPLESALGKPLLQHSRLGKASPVTPGEPLRSTVLPFQRIPSPSPSPLRFWLSLLPVPSWLAEGAGATEDDGTDSQR